MRRVLIVILICWLPMGCSLQQRQNNKLANQLRSQPPERVLSQLQDISPDSSDIVQYHLNLGYLQFITGHVDDAIQTFSVAKKEMQALQAVSVSENVVAGTINETFRQYSGTATDQVMMHNLLALSYLFKGDIYGARVEMLQADVTMKSLASDNGLYGQLASAHLLSAIIYELLDERSNAFISYRACEEILDDRGIAIPAGLKLRLLRTSKQMGNVEQYAHYQDKYTTYVEQALESGKQVFFLYFDGVVSNKVENSVMVPSYDNEQLIRISMPSYPPLRYHPTSISLSSEQQHSQTQLVENIDQLARDDLSKDYPSILLLTTTRAIAKYQLVKEANKHDGLVGALVNIATIVSEVADVRSWNMLPASWQFAYINSNDAELLVGDSAIPVDITQSQQHLFLKTSLSNSVLHYQQ